MSAPVQQRLHTKLIVISVTYPNRDRSTAAGPLEERSDVLGYMLRLSRSAINHVTAAAVGEVLWVICGENGELLGTFSTVPLVLTRNVSRSYHLVNRDRLR